MILFGLFSQYPWMSALLSLIVILSAIYMLYWMQHVYFESPPSGKNTWSDIKAQEMLIALPLVILTLWVGLYPATILKQISPFTEQMPMIQQEKSP